MEFAGNPTTGWKPVLLLNMPGFLPPIHGKDVDFQGIRFPSKASDRARCNIPAKAILLGELALGSV
jgi:hypothetical protein